MKQLMILLVMVTSILTIAAQKSIEQKIKDEFKDPRTTEIVGDINWQEMDAKDVFDMRIAYYEDKLQRFSVLDSYAHEAAKDQKVIDWYKNNADIDMNYQIAIVEIRAQNSFGAFSTDSYYVFKVNDYLIGVCEDFSIIHDKNIFFPIELEILFPEYYTK